MCVVYCAFHLSDYNVYSWCFTSFTSSAEAYNCLLIPKHSRDTTVFFDAEDHHVYFSVKKVPDVLSISFIAFPSKNYKPRESH